MSLNRNSGAFRAHYGGKNRCVPPDTLQNRYEGGSTVQFTEKGE